MEWIKKLFRKENMFGRCIVTVIEPNKKYIWAFPDANENDMLEFRKKLDIFLEGKGTKILVCGGFEVSEFKH